MSEVQKLVPIEERISQELVSHNVTEAVIASLKEKYGHLKIAGIEDRETYDLVKTGRKECKSFRVLAKKICEKGREDAVAIQKAWVGKQKEVTDQIAAIEDPLEEQEKAYEAAVAKDKEDRKRRQEEQLINRQQTLSAMGVLYSEGCFTLGEVSFELSLIKESEQDIWEETILPKFRVEYEMMEEAAIRKAEIKRQEEQELKRQQEELEQKQRELAERESALKKAQEEQEKKQREAEALKAYEERERIEKLWRGRLEQLRPIGWNGQEAFAKYDETVVVATYDQLVSMTDEDFADVLGYHQSNVKKDAEQKEQKRLAEIEALKEAARKAALRKSRLEAISQYGWGDKSDDFSLYSEGDWNNILSDAKDDYDKKQKEKWEKEQAEKRDQEEVVRLQKLDAAKDKEKWDEILRKVNEIEVYEMRSSQYRKKAMILREKLEEIKAL
jgi:multidrug efflux pump subunit AcrA (membrane-fusion protein)